MLTSKLLKNRAEVARIQREAREMADAHVAALREVERGKSPPETAAQRQAMQAFTDAVGRGDFRPVIYPR